MLSIVSLTVVTCVKDYSHSIANLPKQIKRINFIINTLTPYCFLFCWSGIKKWYQSLHTVLIPYIIYNDAPLFQQMYYC